MNRFETLLSRIDAAAFGSPEQAAALSDAIDYVDDHEVTPIERQVFTRGLCAMFGELADAYAKNPVPESPLWDMLDWIATSLPEDTKATPGSTETLRERWAAMPNAPKRRAAATRAAEAPPVAPTAPTVTARPPVAPAAPRTTATSHPAPSTPGPSRAPTPAASAKPAPVDAKGVVTNRFEVLLASPSLNPKDLRIHIRMHFEIPKDVSAQCSQELVNVATRLTDELTTVRFGRDLATGPEPAGYRPFCAAATGSGATPIDYKFFAAFFPASATPEQARRHFDGLTDPVAIHAWAAQTLRVAMNAETQDPANAAAAWGKAVRLYRRLFRAARVEDSYTYQQQTDPQSQDICRQVWDGFLATQVAGLAARMKTYASTQQTAAFQACLAALALPDVAQENPDAAGQAASEAQDAVTGGIDAAASLAAAEQLYQGQAGTDPSAKDTLDRALLRAMAKEAALVSKDFGDLDVLKRCAGHVGLDVPDDRVGSLTRAARTEFYDACTQVARDVLKEGIPAKTQERAAQLLALIPKDWVVGTGLVGNEEIRRDEAIEQLLFRDLGPKAEGLLEKLMKAPADSADEERALNDLIDFAKAHAQFAAGPQTSKAFLGAMSSIFKNAAALSGAQAGTRGLRMMKAIAGYLRNGEQIEIDGESHTAKAWIRIYSKGDREPGVRELVARLSTAPAASAAEEQALTQLITYRKTHSLSTEDREAVDECLVMIFRSSAAKYLEDHDANGRCMSMMNSIVNALPAQTRTSLADENLTLREHRDMLSMLVRLKDAQEAPLGSIKERRAVEALLDGLDEGINFTVGDKRFRDTARTLLTNIMGANLTGGDRDTAQLIASRLGRAAKAKPSSGKKPKPPAKPRGNKDPGPGNTLAWLLTVVAVGLLTFLNWGYMTSLPMWVQWVIGIGGLFGVFVIWFIIRMIIAYIRKE